MPYRVLALIIGLSGQPVGIAPVPSNPAFEDEAACTAAIPEKLQEFQKFLDENPNENIRGNFAAADGKCFSDVEIDEMKHPKNKGA